ncbi:MAG: DegV family protein [Faecalibacterium sp.]|nr:DegV family protein [Faecalibacterium sp.]
MSYQLFTDATADLTEEMLRGLPAVTIIPMEVEIDGQSYTYGPGGNITPAEFYAMQRQGKFASTSQINHGVYCDAFDPVLSQGVDILYFCFSSGLSGTYQSAQIAIRDLKEKYPDRVIEIIDTQCASVGEGFLVREALIRQQAGMSLLELALWADNFRHNVCHWFTVDVFDHLKHGGRVSASTAIFGTMLQIKPLLHVDANGKLELAGKPRGRRKAMDLQIEQMEKGWLLQLTQQVVVGHCGCPEVAEQLKEELLQRFPSAEIFISEIGPIIGAHTGPGTLVLIYCGDNR